MNYIVEYIRGIVGLLNTDCIFSPNNFFNTNLWEIRNVSVFSLFNQALWEPCPSPHPMFLYGPNSFTNISDNEASIFPIVYLDLVESSESILYGTKTTDYNIKLYFGDKVSYDFNIDNHIPILKEMRKLETRFVSAVYHDSAIKGIKNVKTTEILNFNEHDLNTSGIYMTCTITVAESISGCDL